MRRGIRLVWWNALRGEREWLITAVFCQQETLRFIQLWTTGHADVNEN